MDGLKKVFALALVAFLLLAACGDDSGSTDAGGSDGGEDACEQGPVTLDSGLKYEDIECGDGEEVERGDSVEVHYTGTLADGTEFDTSRQPDRGPLPFKVGAGDLIQGFDEGVIGMRVGGVRELTIPPELGYGPAGQPPVIPANATLVFEVEMLEITS